MDTLVPYDLCVGVPISVLNVKVLVAAFNQEKALVGAFSVIVQLRRLIVNSTSCNIQAAHRVHHVLAAVVRPAVAAPPVRLAPARVQAQHRAAARLRHRGRRPRAPQRRQQRPALCGIQTCNVTKKYFTDKNIFLTSVAETVEEPLCPEHGSAGEGGLHGGDVLGGDLLPPGDGLLGPHLQHLVRVLERLGVGAARVVHVGVRGVVAATCSEFQIYQFYLDVLSISCCCLSTNIAPHREHGPRAARGPRSW